MMFCVVAVYDIAAKGYARPAFVPSVGAAVRSFSDEVNRADKDNIMYQHPEDFVLFELGSFDDSTGKFVALENLKQVASGKNVRV